MLLATENFKHPGMARSTGTQKLYRRAGGDTCLHDELLGYEATGFSSDIKRKIDGRLTTGGKAAAAVRCSLLAGGKCHLWTRISKNPKCCNSGEGSVLGGMGRLGLLGNNTILICGVC